MDAAKVLGERPPPAGGIDFDLPGRVIQFTGQWLYLEPASQSRLPTEEGGVNCELGVNAVAGERVWDVGSKFRVRIGPLRYAAFEEYLPDPAEDPVERDSPMPAEEGGVYLSDDLEPVT